ncbi:MAG: dihydrofolate reductase [Verrucomicrobiota bacterium]
MKAIAAMARNRVIGMNGDIPWHLPEDFRWFKKMTMGGTVVMGRKTFESLGKPLPNRRNIVLSRHASVEGVPVVRDLEELKGLLGDDSNVWIIGGAEIYAQTLPMCTDLYLSLVDMEPAGDAFFPDFEGIFECLGTVEEKPGFVVLHYRNRECAESGSKL